jgi:hypothetical protein
MNNLTINDLRTIVPAAFAETPADNVSDRYSFIPSTRVIDEVMKRGWYPSEARQSRRVRDTVHATHMITFRQPNADVKVGDVLPQITLINNHMALHRARLLAGFFRLICSNGLIVGMGVAESRVNKIHIDNAAFEFELAFNDALNTLDTAVHRIAKWITVPLTWDSQIDFAKRALLVKEHDVPFWASQYSPHEFLTRRRDDDRKPDLWTVFNVVQENILKGGVQGKIRETKPITQVVEIERINNGLWQLAEEFGNLHGNN